MMVDKGEHLNLKGLEAIINYKATINKGLSPALKEAFPNNTIVPRPEVIPAPELIPQ